MKNSAFEWALQVGAPDPGTKLILIILAFLQDTRPWRPDHTLAGVQVSLDELATTGSMSLTEVKQRLKILTTVGLVERIPCVDPKTRARVPDLFIVNVGVQVNMPAPVEGGAR